MLEALENIWGFCESLGVLLSNSISTVFLTLELLVSTVLLPAELLTLMPSILAVACVVFFAIYALKFILQFVGFLV